MITTDEFIQNFESKTQTDVVVLDFSKVFDVVPHQRLLHKLDHHGIRETTLNNRTKKAVVDGSSLESTLVMSSVPQGTVLEPLLFLTYINHLSSTVSSQVRLFPDDCLLYRLIKCRADQEKLQKDISVLQPLDMLGPEGVKAEIKTLEFQYTIKGETLANVSLTPYLVVCLSQTLE